MNPFLADLRAELKAKARPLALLWVLTAAVVVALLPFDQPLLAWLTRGWNEPTADFAHFLFTWGDASHGGVIVCAALWLCGKALRRPRWRQAAGVALLSGLVAGAMATSVRWTTGRPRPRYSMERQYFNPQALAAYNRHDTWYERRLHGFSIENDLHSFPSAHVSGAMGTATPILLLAPSWGGPATAAALVVGWSRMYKLDHHPSDVVAGLALGATCGWIAVGVHRRRSLSS